jgi:hypothetical protein
MSTGSPQLVELWSCVSSTLMSHTPHRRRTGSSGGATWRGVRSDLGGVSQLILAPTILSSFYIYIFFVIRLPLCNKYSDYCDIYLYTLCYYICCLLGACMRCTWLCSLKPGCTEVVSEEMLTVGRNLDRNGQNPYLLTLFRFILYLPYSDYLYTYLDLVSPSTVLLWLLLSFLLQDMMDFTPWNPTFITF